MRIESTTAATAEELAHLLGITSRQVQRLAKAGILPRSARGSYDLAAGVQAWGAYLSQGKATAELGSERRRLTSAQAYRAEIENKRIDGQLFLAADVEIVVSAAMTVVAAGLDSLGGRLAAELAAESDPGVIRQRLLRETRQIRAAAADRLQNLAASGGQSTEAPKKKPRATGRRK